MINTILDLSEKELLAIRDQPGSTEKRLKSLFAIVNLHSSLERKKTALEDRETAVVHKEYDMDCREEYISVKLDRMEAKRTSIRKEHEAAQRQHCRSLQLSAKRQASLIEHEREFTTRWLEMLDREERAHDLLIKYDLYKRIHHEQQHPDEPFALHRFTQTDD
jgi:hypothetical protein